MKDLRTEKNLMFEEVATLAPSHVIEISLGNHLFTL